MTFDDGAARSRLTRIAQSGQEAEANDGHLLHDRALARVGAAYGTAYGHPTAGAGYQEPPAGRRRWALSARTVTVAGVVLILLAVVVALGALRSARTPDLTVSRPFGGSTATASAAGAGTPTAGSAEAPTGSAATGASTGAQVGAASSGGAQVVVHVVGQVNHAGLVTLPVGARVADALTAAGGPTPTADTAALNLARPVTDGEQIVVPKPGESPVAVAGGAGSTGGVASGAGGAGALVDLNAADAAALDALPGIGPVLAERIVAWRAEHGRFTDVAELGEVSGIGSAVLEKLRDRVRV